MQDADNSADNGRAGRCGRVPWGYYWGSEHWKDMTAVASIGGPSSGGSQSVTTAAMEDRASPAGKEAGQFLAQTPVVNLAGVFRFDVTPDALFRQWPRVSVGLGQLDLQGYRVSLVTGTAEDDLAGSLTYYFTPQTRVQRITFYGSTGDPRKLLSLLGAELGFTRHVVNAPGLFLYEVPDSGSPPRSLLRIEAAEVVKADEPCRRYKVTLAIERPGSRR